MIGLCWCRADRDQVLTVLVSRGRTVTERVEVVAAGGV
jgi:hypothetical protein